MSILASLNYLTSAMAANGAVRSAQATERIAAVVAPATDPQASPHVPGSLADIIWRATWRPVAAPPPAPVALRREVIE